MATKPAQRRGPGVRGSMAVLLAFAWGFLAVVAIGLGRSREWPGAAGVGVGAAVCLFVALLLWTRERAVRRGAAPARHRPTHRR